MNIKRVSLLIILLLSTFGVSAQIIEPVSWSRSVDSKGDGVYDVTFSAALESPWHIYDLGPYDGGPNATSFEFELPASVERVGELVQISESHRQFDDIFGMEIGTIGQEALFRQSFKVNSKEDQKIVVTVEWQACDDGSCLPPTTHDFKLTLKGDASASVAATAAADGEGSSMWAIIIEAILWGFAALLTPCVFPMVPMTVSFFMKGASSPAKGRMMASMYGTFIVALYTLPIAAIILITYLLGGDAVTANIFNWLATHWLPNVIFFLIFMIFAASFFGAFEIVMPQSLVNKSDSKADKGGLVGTFFMALTLVLVSFSCTGPIVGSILVKSTQGQIWEPIITMLVFSAAFALPFTIFAFFPSLLKNLPKSGGWLNSVKVTLGFIELALGLKFLSVADQTYHWGILDREVYLALWIVIFSLLGAYFLGKIKFAHDSDTPYIKVKSLFLAIITFAFVVYLIPGMFGAPLKALSGYLPPMHTLDFNITAPAAVSSSTDQPKGKYSDFLHLPHGLDGFFDYEEGMAYAKEVGKPAFLDFTGHGCVNCREMEANVWSDPAVLKLLKEEYVIIALYVDDKKELPKEDWITIGDRTLKTVGNINANFQVDKFGVNAQPYYVILGGDGEQLLPARGYNLDKTAFVQFLEEGIKIYEGDK